MEKDNPLLPFAYTNSSINDSIPYDTTPRDKSTIDENASSKYHTRKTVLSASSPLKPQLRRVALSEQRFLPSLKEKWVKVSMTKIILKESTLKIPTTTQMKKETPTVINIDIDNDNEQDENDKYQLPPSSPPPALYSDAPLVSEFDFTTNIEYNFRCPSHLPRKLI